MAEITDEELKNLWSDPSFPGHYSGITYFQDSLKYTRNIIVSQARIRKVLNSIRNYQLHVLPKMYMVSLTIVSPSKLNLAVLSSSLKLI